MKLGMIAALPDDGDGAGPELAIADGRHCRFPTRTGRAYARHMDDKRPKDASVVDVMMIFLIGGALVNGLLRGLMHLRG